MIVKLEILRNGAYQSIRYKIQYVYHFTFNYEAHFKSIRNQYVDIYLLRQSIYHLYDLFARLKEDSKWKFWDPNKIYVCEYFVMYEDIIKK